MTLPDWPPVGWVVVAALSAWVAASVVMLADLVWELARAVWLYYRSDRVGDR